MDPALPPHWLLRYIDSRMTQMTLPQAFEMAMRQQQAGNLAAAESIYRQVLAAVPDQPDALHMLGLLAMQARKFDLAMQLIDRSIQVNPRQPGYYANRAQLLSMMGRIDEAVAAYRMALSLDPNLLEANYNLGHLLRQQGDIHRAVEHYRAAVNILPASPDLWTSLALALSDARDFPAAADAWRRITLMQPENPDAINNLGNVLQEMGRYDEAIEAYQKALSLRPEYPEAHNNIGNAYLRSGRPEQAVECFRAAVAQRPDYAEAHRGLGNALKNSDRYEEAITAHQESIRLQPNNAEAHSDYGTALHASARFEEAAQQYERAIQLAPDFAAAHFNLGLSLLLRGRFEEGWAKHEWRSKVASHIASHIRFPMPAWNGETLDGKRLLIYAEQGFGDMIMAARYLPLAAARGGRIIFICPQEMVTLLGKMPGIDEVVIPQDEFPKVEADVQRSLMSLPYVFGTTEKTIPAEVPYLHADPERAAQFHSRVLTDDGKLKVGLVWSGRSFPDPKRSMTLDVLAPLAQVRNVQLFSLQLGDAAQQIASAPPGLEISDITSDMKDFADTAALIEHLDLIVSIDTATAHLAGAMGKPTWVLLPWVPDWRWMLGREDSPWYPTMKLFRQPTFGNWETPVNRVVEELKKLSRFPSPGTPGEE